MVGVGGKQGLDVQCEVGGHDSYFRIFWHLHYLIFNYWFSPEKTIFSMVSIGLPVAIIHCLLIFAHFLYFSFVIKT